MRHLTDGALRRLYDEPYALDEGSRAHYHSCPACRERFTAVAEDARRSLALMAVPAATVDARAALGRVRARPRPGRSRLAVLRGSGWRRPALGGAVAAVLVAGLVATMAFTPLAAGLVSIFEPAQVTTVSIGQGDLTGLDAFSGWADVRWARQPELQQVGSAAEAAAVSGLPEIRVDASRLPAGLSGAQAAYAAVGQASGTATFTSSAPSKIRGSTLSVQVGPAETAIYGDLGGLATAAGGAGGREASAQSAQSALAAAGPIVGIAVMRAPVVTSTGATVADIKSVLLAQPGLSPAVRSAIGGIDNPKGNLPIPIPAGQVNAHAVTVQGVPGTAFGDDTGLGSALIWIKNGRVYGVAGTLTGDQVLALANGLN